MVLAQQWPHVKEEDILKLVNRQPVGERPDYVNKKTACKILKITPPTLRKLIANGHIPIKRFGKVERIPVSALSA